MYLVNVKIQNSLKLALSYLTKRCLKYYLGREQSFEKGFRGQFSIFSEVLKMGKFQPSVAYKSVSSEIKIVQPCKTHLSIRLHVSKTSLSPSIYHSYCRQFRGQLHYVNRMCGCHAIYQFIGRNFRGQNLSRFRDFVIQRIILSVCEILLWPVAFAKVYPCKSFYQYIISTSLQSRWVFFWTTMRWYFANFLENLLRITAQIKI